MKFTKLFFQVPIAVDVGDNIRDSKNDDVFVSLILGKQCFLIINYAKNSGHTILHL